MWTQRIHYELTGYWIIIQTKSARSQHKPIQSCKSASTRLHLHSTKMPSWFRAVFFILPKHFGDSITSTPTVWWSWPVSITPPPKERTQKRAWDYVGAQFWYVFAIFSQILPCKFCFTHSYITASNATVAVKIFFESSSFACINITRYSIWWHNRSQNEC